MVTRRQRISTGGPLVFGLPLAITQAAAKRGAYVQYAVSTTGAARAQDAAGGGAGAGGSRKRWMRCLVLGVLCVLPACGGDGRDPTGLGEGTLDVITSTIGVPEDPDGYTLTVDHGAALALPSNGTTSVGGLSPGIHEVELAGIAGFCVLANENPHTVEVAAGDTASLRFDLTCDTPVLQISVATTGDEPDVDGYGVSIDGTDIVSLPPDDSVDIPFVSSGHHTVALTGVAPNCAVIGEHPRGVDVVDGQGAVHFDVACHLSNTLNVEVTTTGPDVDPDGYVAAVNGGSRIGLTGVPGFLTGGWRLPPGDYTVTLADVAPNCRPSTPGQATATVPNGGITTVSLSVRCEATQRGHFGRDLLLDVRSDIYLLSADGRRFVNLTNHPEDEFFATFSPDSSRIAFASVHYVIDIPGPMGSSHWESNVFAMNPDGTGRTQLTNGFREEGPAWSPDGSKLAFVSSRRDRTVHLVVMHPDGSGQTELASLGLGGAFVSPEPAWSPGGARIVYSREVTDQPGLFVIKADGTGDVRLTDGVDLGAAWSPDGARIAFIRTVVGQGDAVWVMNADGSGLTRVAADTGGSRHYLAWSPDGMRIAFELNGRIYLVGADGTGLMQLTFTPEASFPTWSSDGRRIAYYQSQNDQTRLLLMDLDGSGEVPLTPDLAGAGIAVSRPVPVP